MKLFLFACLFLGALNAQASTRSGNTSFGGIQVKVTASPEEGWFKIGESKFVSPVLKTSAGHVMRASRRVGINLADETLTATLFLDGGNGGEAGEYLCSNARVKISRLADDGKLTVLKNECAFLDWR